MRVMGVAEAARRLGVSPRRVRQMISGGHLAARRVGRVWAIDEHDLNAARRRPAHRPWKPESAWAVLAAAEGAPPPSLSAYERHRALKRLQKGLASLAPLLSERADRRTFYTHPADLDRIIATPGVVRTAASAAEEHSIDLVGPGPAEAYVTEATLGRIMLSHHIEERSERPNLVLRVTPDAHWPFPDGAKVAPKAVTAVDLLESGEERARRAGRELLEAL